MEASIWLRVIVCVRATSVTILRIIPGGWSTPLQQEIGDIV